MTFVDLDENRVIGEVVGRRAFEPAFEPAFWHEPVDARFRPAFFLCVPGDPHGKESVRVFQDATRPSAYGSPLRPVFPRDLVFGAASSAGGAVRGRTSTKTRAVLGRFETLCRHARVLDGFTKPLFGPLLLRALSVKRRPRSFPKEAIPLHPDRPEGRWLCPVTPDWDNLGKTVGDGLAQGGILGNDARVVDGRVVTLYAALGEKPFMDVAVFGIPASAKIS